jgi:hypothetical protein
MGFEDGGTGSCSEVCATCGVDGTEEFSINVEEAKDIKDKFSQAISFQALGCL